MRPQSFLWKTAGFTILEMTIVLAASALLGMAVWKFLPVIRKTSEVSTSIALREAQAALEGFILRENRLPCPDTSGNGLENCTGDSVGKLPEKTLGISLPHPLRYGVFRNPSALTEKDADLSSLKNRYIPTLPPGAASSRTNGLDFCLAVRNAIQSPTTSLVAGDVPIAYAIADAGANTQFDGDNTLPNRFASPDAARTASYDDAVLATGLTELSGRLNCPKALGDAQGVVRAAYAAYDNDRNAEMLKSFCSFNYSVQEGNVKMATTNALIAASDLFNAGATGVTSIAVAMATLGASLAGPSIGAVLGIIGSAGALAAMIGKQVMALLAKDKAEQKKKAADNYRTKMLIQRSNALAEALKVDQKGLTP